MSVLPSPAALPVFTNRHALFLGAVVAREHRFEELMADLTAGEDPQAALLRATAGAITDLVVQVAGQPWVAEVEVAVDLFVASMASEVEVLFGEAGTSPVPGEVILDRAVVAELADLAVSAQSVWLV